MTLQILPGFAPQALDPMHVGTGYYVLINPVAWTERSWLSGKFPARRAVKAARRKACTDQAHYDNLIESGQCDSCGQEDI